MPAAMAPIHPRQSHSRSAVVAYLQRASKEMDLVGGGVSTRMEEAESFSSVSSLQVVSRSLDGSLLFFARRQRMLRSGNSKRAHQREGKEATRKRSLVRGKERRGQLGTLSTTRAGRLYTRPFYCMRQDEREEEID